MQTDPNAVMLATKMAQHYHTTLNKIRAKKGKRFRTWLTMSKEDRDDSIRAFMVILSMADDEQMKQNQPKKRNDIMQDL